MKNCKIEKINYRVNVISDENKLLYFNDIKFYINDGTILAEIVNSQKLQECQIKDGKIVKTFGETVIDDLTLNSELKRKNKLKFDGSTFVYKNILYICLDNEDYKISNPIQYDMPEYTSYAEVVTISERSIWCRIDHDMTNYKDLYHDSKAIEEFFKANSLLAHNRVRGNEILSLPKDKRKELIELISKGL